MGPASVMDNKSNNKATTSQTTRPQQVKQQGHNKSNNKATTSTTYVDAGPQQAGGGLNDRGSP